MSRDGEGLPNAAETRLEWNKVILSLIYQGILTLKDLMIGVMYGFHQVWYQGIVKATGSGVLEDLTFKISEGSDQN